MHAVSVLLLSVLTSSFKGFRLWSTIYFIIRLPPEPVLSLKTSLHGHS